MGAKTKIDWCDSSWNPVTGCLHGCEYCYARGIANRFGLPYAPKLGDPGMEGAKKYDSTEGMDTMLELVKPYEKNGRKQPYPMCFLPTFHRYKLEEPQHWKKPRTIFVCSMADLFGEWVPEAWIKAVFDACAAAPQHRYLFLTKNPNRYAELAIDWKLPMNCNMWYGTSTPTPNKPYFNSNVVNAFISVEPMLTTFGGFRLTGIKWAILGAETGNRKGKVVPEKEWIMCFANACAGIGIPVFMKESLRPIMGADFKQEFPWETP